MGRLEDALKLKEEIKKLDQKIDAAREARNNAEARDSEQQKKQKLKAFLPKYSDEDIRNWIGKGKVERETILFTEFFGNYLALSSMSTSQIRNVFGEVKRMEMEMHRGFPEQRLLVLPARLAYTTKRNATEGSKAFFDKMEIAIDEIFKENNENNKEDRFEKFTLFFESILAYHRAGGGK